MKMPRHPRLRTPILALAIALACPLLVVLNHAKVVGFETLGLDNALKINAVSIFWLAALLVTRWALSQRQAAFLWDCSVVALPVVWAVLLARASEADLATLVQRDATTRDAVRAGYLMLGVVHATGGRSLRWKLAIGSVGLLITLVGDSLALCSTLADFECAALVRLPLLNVCIPFAIGFAAAHSLLQDAAHAKMEALRVRLNEVERRSGELEAARRASLRTKALSTTSCAPTTRHVSPRSARLGTVSPPLSLPPGPPSSNASMVDHSEEWGLEDQTTPRTEAGPPFGPTTQADIAEEDEARLTASPPPKFGASPRKDSGAPVCSGRLRTQGLRIAEQLGSVPTSLSPASTSSSSPGFMTPGWNPAAQAQSLQAPAAAQEYAHDYWVQGRDDLQPPQRTESPTKARRMG